MCRALQGVGAELGIHQQSVQSVCQRWAQARSTSFRRSFGLTRARGWVPFQEQSRQIDGNSVVYRGQRYRFFGSKRRPQSRLCQDRKDTLCALLMDRSHLQAFGARSMKPDGLKSASGTLNTNGESNEP